MISSLLFSISITCFSFSIQAVRFTSSRELSHPQTRKHISIFATRIWMERHVGEPLVVAYGGGVNSTALLIGLHARGRVPELILFADTGGEKPETYEYLSHLNSWLMSIGFPLITQVANDGKYVTLEAECLAKGTLPSLAFGWRSCSDKYKRRPQDKYVASWAPAVSSWASGGRVVKMIGIDAGEAHRASKSVDDNKYRYEFPLIEWDWGREECLSTIVTAGLPLPPKSACFFCPASRRSEILTLADRHPELLARALAIEEGAKAILTSVKGLGRRFSWGDFIADRRISLQSVSELPVLACQCFDGE